MSMLSKLELKKKKLELSRVKYAHEEMEVKILEREEDILRIKDNMKIQQARIEELEAEIALGKE